MKGLKETLALIGIALIVLGVLLHLSHYPKEEQHEEIYTGIWEKEPTENFQEHGDVEAPKAGWYTAIICEDTGEKITMTKEEQELLMKLAYAEAGNQGVEGMWLVMSVVINRVNSPDYPNTITGVIYQDKQFSTVKNGALDKAVITDNCREALLRILSGDVKPDIIGFETTKSKVLDKWFQASFEHKDHRFYVAKSK